MKVKSKKLLYFHWQNDTPFKRLVLLSKGPKSTSYHFVRPICAHSKKTQWPSFGCARLLVDWFMFNTWPGLLLCLQNSHRGFSSSLIAGRSIHLQWAGCLLVALVHWTLNINVLLYKFVQISWLLRQGTTKQQKMKWTPNCQRSLLQESSLAKLPGGVQNSLGTRGPPSL